MTRLIDFAGVVRPVEQVQAAAGRPADIRGAAVQVLWCACVDHERVSSAKRQDGRRLSAVLGTALRVQGRKLTLRKFETCLSKGKKWSLAVKGRSVTVSPHTCASQREAVGKKARRPSPETGGVQNTHSVEPKSVGMLSSCFVIYPANLPEGQARVAANSSRSG